MKPEPNHAIEKYRDRRFSDSSYGNNGAFFIRRKDVELRVIASDGEGWDHVSVSVKNRCPTWSEMCFVKDIFFDAEEVVMQLHPAKSQYVNNHPNCLHLWRPQQSAIPMPEAWMVGIIGASPEEISAMRALIESRTA